MKTILTLFVLFFSFALSAEIYFCVEDQLSGYKSPDHQKLVEFEPRRFKANIDFDNNKLVSNDIFFKSTSIMGGNCSKSLTSLMTCNDAEGSTFVISKLSNRFVYTSGFGYIYNQGDVVDDVYFSIGKCEKF